MDARAFSQQGVLSIVIKNLVAVVMLVTRMDVVAG